MKTPTIITILLILTATIANSQSLIKPIQYKGMTLNYWKVTSYQWTLESGKTLVTLMPYATKKQSETRERDYIEELRKQMEFNGRVRPANLIDSIVVSRPQVSILEPEIPAVIGAKGDTISKAIPAKTEIIETNFFATAIPD